MVDFEERLLIKNIRKHVLGKLSTFLLLWALGFLLGHLLII
jgi:hypothetical protein